MTAYERVQTIRGTDRPTAQSYIRELFSGAVELHGDRFFADDEAIIAGLAYLSKETPPELSDVRALTDSLRRPGSPGLDTGAAVTYIGIERGGSTMERIRRNFGSPRPEGYRKAMRLMEQAEKFSRPVITLIDTSGAFCGVGAEERGQGEAIARNLYTMAALETPIITVVIGEGGSGGALGLAVSDRLYMLENAMYSVISPEGCAGILWKDSSRAAEAAEHLHATAEYMLRFGVADGIIPERFEDFSGMCDELRERIRTDIAELSALPPQELVRRRYERFRRLGAAAHSCAQASL